MRPSRNRRSIRVHSYLFAQSLKPIYTPLFAVGWLLLRESSLGEVNFLASSCAVGFRESALEVS